MMPTSSGRPAKSSFFENRLPKLLWGVVVVMLIVMTALLASRMPAYASVAEPAPEEVAVQPELIIPEEGTVVDAALPDYAPVVNVLALQRQTDAHTIMPTKMRSGAVKYTVAKGDSIFSISQKYKLKPETVLWANYSLLNDNPNMLSVGQELTIPPTDGIYYKWKTNDNLDVIAQQYRVDKEAIVMYPGNKLDVTNPVIEADTYVMVPGGWRENQQWLVPTVWRANSGASRNISGCEVSGGAFGSGSFVWPAGNHYLSGNDYWSGHLGIDIAAGEGAPLYAADSGVVVYAGSIGGGYGLMVMIDHGNGYHTLYAHMSSITVTCGQSVGQGSGIGYAGSTGNSTGAHLHFEVRYNGGFINPWYVLP